MTHRAGLRRLVPRKYLRSQRLLERVMAASGGRVMSGPFAGMMLVDSSFCSVRTPKLLGTYELELHDAVEAALSRSPRNVVVAGAAEGFYAVGIALRLPLARLTAFEANPEARAALENAARANGLSDRIVVAKLCDAGGMREALAAGDPSLVVCDIEGSEGVLMDPAIVPELLESEILVETHDFLAAGVADLVAGRFERSHLVTRIDQRPRSVEDAPRLGLPGSFAGALLQAMNEHRPARNGWLHLALRPRRLTVPDKRLPANG